MKIGMFTANYMDRDLESVFKLMAEHVPRYRILLENET